MLNGEAREGGKLQSEVSDITGNSTGQDLHYNSTTLEPQENYAKSATRAQKKDTDSRKRKELIKRCDL